MKEYVERGDLLKDIGETVIFTVRGGTPLPNAEMRGANKVIDRIKSAKAADVVEVVRCKDCVYYEANSCFNRQWDFESSTEIPLVRENDFCSYGAKMDGKGEGE